MLKPEQWRQQTLLKGTTRLIEKPTTKRFPTLGIGGTGTRISTFAAQANISSIAIVALFAASESITAQVLIPQERSKWTFPAL